MTELTTLQKALYTIKKLQQQLQAVQLHTPQPIAIIGLSCRFPQVSRKSDYWHLLCQGKSVISPLPVNRWKLLEGTQQNALRDESYPYYGGYLNQIEAFDAYFFGISPREALLMDPQQRLLLEVAYEAIEDAGLPITALAGSNTGVFAGLDEGQFVHLQKLEHNLDPLYFATGNSTSITANRISYLFDLQGPSIAVDTACSGSLVAAHLACLHLQNKLCDLALVCGANINLLPVVNLMLAKAKLLASDGICKVFDAMANGYIQGEGVGVMVLKPLDRALADHDRIYAVIEGSAVNQDGASRGLTTPNGLQQEQLLKSAYLVAKIDPNTVSYVECHGSGAFFADAVEVTALGKVISQHRSADNPCWLGSVKANLGHLEPAAGIASLIKVALSLHHGKIFPQIHFTTPNPHIDFQHYHFSIAEQSQPWLQDSALRIAGVSGFGLGGTNAHIVLRGVNQPMVHIPKAEPGKAELFTISAKTPMALKALIDAWCAYLAGNLSLDIAQICYNLHLRRSHYAARLAIIVETTDALYHALCQVRENPQIHSSHIFINAHPSRASVQSALVNSDKMDVGTLANYYIQQANINWQHYERHRRYPHCDLPLYAWERQRYWFRLMPPQNGGVMPIAAASVNAISNRWIPYRQTQPNAKVRLFCFSYTGGGASIYRDWQASLPDFIEVCPIQLPGREERIEEMAISDIDSLLSELVKLLHGESDIPFAFFGHDLGGLIAFAFTTYLRRQNLPLPVHLFVSAYTTPNLPHRNVELLIQRLDAIDIKLFDLANELLLSRLSDTKIDELLNLFVQMGVFEPSYHGNHYDKIRLWLPIFAADIAMMQSYSYLHELPLDLPITVFLGQQDNWAAADDHLGWAAQTHKQCRVHEFDSGHLFIHDPHCKKEIIRVIEGIL